MKTDSTPIGKLVQSHRKSAKLSQAALAALAGVGKTAIFDLEHGKETIQWDTLTKILHALNIKVTFISPLLVEEGNSRHEKS